MAPGGKYPKVGYMTFYRLDVTELLPFDAKHESSRRVFVDPNEVQKLLPNWNQMVHLSLQAAMALEP